MCELPPEFPLASPSSGIVHHLSGPTARAFSSERGSVRLAFRFRFADGFGAHRLARAMDSLVRVSRRVACDEKSERRTRTPREKLPKVYHAWANGHASETSSKAVPHARFRVLFTLFPKSFSAFPHGTSSLSDSRSCLTLDGAHHPLELRYQTVRLWQTPTDAPSTYRSGL